MNIPTMLDGVTLVTAGIFLCFIVDVLSTCSLSFGLILLQIDSKDILQNNKILCSEQQIQNMDLGNQPCIQCPQHSSPNHNPSPM